MNKNNYKNPLNMLLAMLFAVVLVSCGGNNEVGSENMISGTNNKTWVADEEMNSSGQEVEPVDKDQQGGMQFYADGRFALGESGVLRTGTWSFDQSAKRLTLQFEDQNVTQNFEVTKLTEDEMNLKVPDGSEMKLKAKK
ncbi:lipocalin family protein [Pontibacter brevis]